MVTKIKRNSYKMDNFGIDENKIINTEESKEAIDAIFNETILPDLTITYIYDIFLPDWSCKPFVLVLLCISTHLFIDIEGNIYYEKRNTIDIEGDERGYYKLPTEKLHLTKEMMNRFIDHQKEKYKTPYC